jgi:hypothetical protein
MVGTALKTLLADVTATVYGGLVPDSPGSDWIVYTMISCVPHNTKSGASTYDTYRFQLDCYSRTPERVDTLAASVRSTLDEYEGTSESVVIDHIFFDGQYDAFTSIEEMESREDFFRRTQDYIICVRP